MNSNREYAEILKYAPISKLNIYAARVQCLDFFDVYCGCGRGSFCLVRSRSPADSLCGLPKWWRAAQPLLPPKLQGTKTTNKSKSPPGVGVGGGGVDVVVSFDW